MTPASWPRPDGLTERMLVVDATTRHVRHRRVADLPSLLDPGDVVVVNDAATVPASLSGRFRGAPVELRLVSTADGETWRAVLFGEGDARTRTEDRPPPPRVVGGEIIDIVGEGGATTLRAVVVSREALSERLLHVRFALAHGASTRAGLWSAIYDAGKPVQYAHVTRPLPLWHVQTAFAGAPWAVEMPSAGRPLGARTLVALRSKTKPRRVGNRGSSENSAAARRTSPSCRAAAPWRIHRGMETRRAETQATMPGTSRPWTSVSR